MGFDHADWRASSDRKQAEPDDRVNQRRTGLSHDDRPRPRAPPARAAAVHRREKARSGAGRRGRRAEPGSCRCLPSNRRGRTPWGGESPRPALPHSRTLPFLATLAPVTVATPTQAHPRGRDMGRAVHGLRGDHQQRRREHPPTLFSWWRDQLEHGRVCAPNRSGR